MRWLVRITGLGVRDMSADNASARHEMEPDHKSTNRPDGYLCPECGSATLVRAAYKTGWRLRGRYMIRCLTCGHRFGGSRECWRHLRWPELGDPYESISDKAELMRQLPMTAGQIVCVCLGVAFSVATTFYLVFALRVHELLAFGIFLPMTYGAWWIGRFLFPAKREPGQFCVNCGFDLRACTEPRCPECNTPFDPRRVREKIPRPSEPGGSD